MIRYSPEGTEIERVGFPVKMLTSVCFGGSNLDRIYVTSGMGHQRGGEWGATAGALFSFDPRVKGLPEFWSRVCI